MFEFFSSTTTRLPPCAAAMAPPMPDAPAPMTTTSASSCSTAPAGSVAPTRLRALALPPACSTHDATACTMPMLVSVAPVTVSTPRPCALTMRAGICSSAGAEMRSVSALYTTRTPSMACSEKSASTTILSNLPSASPVYVPALYDASSPAAFGAHPAKPATCTPATAAVPKNVLLLMPVRARLFSMGSSRFSLAPETRRCGLVRVETVPNAAKTGYTPKVGF